MDLEIGFGKCWKSYGSGSELHEIKIFCTIFLAHCCNVWIWCEKLVLLLIGTEKSFIWAAENYSLKDSFSDSSEELFWKSTVFTSFFFLILLKYSWFTMLCYFLLYSKVTQLYMCTYIYTHLYIIFYILFYDGLSQSIEDSSLCYIVGPCCSSQKPAF